MTQKQRIVTSQELENLTVIAEKKNGQCTIRFWLLDLLFPGRTPSERDLVCLKTILDDAEVHEQYGLGIIPVQGGNRQCLIVPPLHYREFRKGIRLLFNNFQAVPREKPRRQLVPQSGGRSSPPGRSFR